MIKPRTPPGVMELLPRDQIAFQRMLDTIRQVFERFGFLPVETPVMELSEVLLTKSGGETERQVYFVQSTGALEKSGEGLPELALRFDLTVPLARYVAEHEHELAFPFRRYQMQRVCRGERAQRGRFREFYQCDIDVVGKDVLSTRFDAEIPAVTSAVIGWKAKNPVTLDDAARTEVEAWLHEHPDDAARVRLWAADAEALRMRLALLLNRPLRGMAVFESERHVGPTKLSGCDSLTSEGAQNPLNPTIFCGLITEAPRCRPRHGRNRPRKTAPPPARFRRRALLGRRKR